MSSEHHARELRFEFGRNWTHFLAHVNEERIQQAVQSLKDMLKVETLEGRDFVDIGCGSGLFSLAARRLGARVVSFDYDPQCVAATEELKLRYRPGDREWRIQHGSVLDSAFLQSLGQFDLGYSWGVLHHTGDMWTALENASRMVRHGGTLFISIYNDQNYISRRWLWVKKTYCRLPQGLRFLVTVPAFLQLWGRQLLVDTLKLHPLRSWRAYGRGMAAWTGVVDWVGGYPFEVAKPEEIFDFFLQRGFQLRRLKTCGGGLGCNEFVFEKCGELHASLTPLRDTTVQESSRVG
jgi:2-polyprenyl-3-methyl-5-hydroxy-6-metoxy-1,4-benzoquinol methylase